MLASAVAVALLAGGVLLLLRHQVSTGLRIDAVSGIDERGFVQIGGMPQWIEIRGQLRDAPVILFLHGGPGAAPLSATSRYLLDWERHFVVVRWHQRGAGRSFASPGSEELNALSIEQLVQDGLELSEHLRGRLQRRQIVLVGHSWGTMLGFRMAQARAQDFSALVATGMLVNFDSQARELFSMQRQAAVNSGDAAEARRAEARLQQLPRIDEDQVDALAHPFAATIVPLLSPEFPWRERGNYLKGIRASAVLLPHIAAGDLMTRPASIDVPFILIQGERDVPITARAFFDRVQSPHKQWLLMHGGDHYALATHSSQFTRELVTRLQALLALL